MKNQNNRREKERERERERAREGEKKKTIELSRWFEYALPHYRSDSIHAAKYDGSNIVTILQGHKSLYHPFAITVFEHLVYWTDWRTNTVNKANKFTGENVTEIQRTNTQPFDIHMYHPDRQPVEEGKMINILHADYNFNVKELKTEIFSCNQSGYLKNHWTNSRLV